MATTNVCVPKVSPVDLLTLWEASPKSSRESVTGSLQIIAFEWRLDHMRFLHGLFKKGISVSYSSPAPLHASLTDPQRQTFCGLLS